MQFLKLLFHPRTLWEKESFVKVADVRIQQNMSHLSREKGHCENYFLLFFFFWFLEKKEKQKGKKL
jgi:hypothetical protein